MQRTLPEEQMPPSPRLPHPSSTAPSAIPNSPISTIPITTTTTTTTSSAKASVQGGQSFYFGPWKIRAREQIFYASPLSLGLVNLKPVVPGHCLVIPRRLVLRVADLTPAEACDLFLTTQLISNRLEKLHAATSLTLTIQDGVHAGQTVPHVHAHIIPRVAGDWLNNDEIYTDIKASELEMGRAMGIPTGHRHVILPEQGPDAQRPPRTTQEMTAEVARLRPFFPESLNIWDCEDDDDTDGA